MSIDLSNLFSDMAQSASGALEEGGEAVSQQMQAVLENNKESIAELIQARQNGDLNNEEFEVEMEREKQVMEAELISLEIMAKSAIQKAMNAAMDTLKSTVAAAI